MIFDDTDTDFFGLGYSTQKSGSGRSELVEPATLNLDELLLRFDLFGAAESPVEAQAPYTQQGLDAYAAGVNARLNVAWGWVWADT